MMRDQAGQLERPPRVVLQRPLDDPPHRIEASHRRHEALGPLALVVTSALLLGVGGQGYWRITEEAHKRAGMVDNPMLDVAASIRELSMRDELIVVRSEKKRVDELWKRRNNFEDPRLFYQTRLHGWVVPADGFDVASLEQLRKDGAALVFDWAGASPGPTRDWLEANGEVLLDQPRARLYRLKSGD